ncbi:hypothetical protein EVA_16317 [gut metagenome]|uniref:Uncharacterized protein n=1 Tax=gut metagenome TaxID=749906 RepID=J9G1B3_9ZZZZ
MPPGTKAVPLKYFSQVASNRATRDLSSRAHSLLMRVLRLSGVVAM